MTNNQTLRLFSEIKVWSRGDKRAPHKPLLLLYALGKLQQGRRWLLYADLEEDVTHLFKEFASYYTTTVVYPFQYLQTDGLWTYHPQKPSRFSTRLLREEAISGGFTDQVYKELSKAPELLATAALQLLNDHFPDSLHQDILAAVNLEIKPPQKEPEIEDPETAKPLVFNAEVLRVYDNRCALCGLDIKIGTELLALEATHIKWRQYGGPDQVNNGLAFCSLHRRLFDGGAFSLIPDQERYVCQISRLAKGSRGLKEWLWSYHDHYLSQPNDPLGIPKLEYVTWHRTEVFRGLPISL